jgi:hypothetical protein
VDIAGLIPVGGVGSAGKAEVDQQGAIETQHVVIIESADPVADFVAGIVVTLSTIM